MGRMVWVVALALVIAAFGLGGLDVAHAQGPYPCSGTVFDDVNAGTVGDVFCGYIEHLALLGVTGGCAVSPPLYCPLDPVTRDQVAVFVGRALGVAATAAGDITAVTAGPGLTGGGTSGPVTLSVDTGTIQARVTGSCPADNYVRAIDATGNVTCQADANSGGTVTSVDSGLGLTGGPITGSGTLAVDTNVIQARVTGTCGVSQYVQGINANGTVSCGTDAGGTITGVTAGTGLTGGGTTGTVALDVTFGGSGAATTAARSDHGHDTLTLIPGSAFAPSLRFTSSANTGLFSSVPDSVDIATGGFTRATVGPAGNLTLTGSLDLAPSTAGQGNVLKSGQRFLHDTGTNNTFLGVQAGNFTLVGSDNTAVGVSALAGSIVTTFSTAVGTGALLSSLVGTNTAVGAAALASNTTGSGNTALGRSALGINLFSLNTGIGDSALSSNMLGDRNTAVGYIALNQATGVGNIAVGSGAGGSLTTGDLNIYIGNSGATVESGVIRLGEASVQNRIYVAGAFGTTTVNGNAVPLLIDDDGQLGTNNSTRRVKDDIRDMGEASRAVLRLRPVTFRYRQPQRDGAHPLQYGLVAEVFPELVVLDADGQPLTVRYHMLPALLLNEVQRQAREIAELRAELRSLVERLGLAPAGGIAAR
jgi:hypothetical protein